MLNRLKWFSTLVLISGFGLFSAGVELGWYLQILGGITWLIAALIMRDRALVVTNAAMVLVGILGKLIT